MAKPQSVEIIDALHNCQFTLETRQIAAPLPSCLKTRQSSIVTGEPSTKEVDGGTKMGVGGGGKVGLRLMELTNENG